MENHLWIIDVLEDLEKYSSTNRLPLVAMLVGLTIDAVHLDLTRDATPASGANTNASASSDVSVA
jgi:hypothetical protein